MVKIKPMNPKESLHYAIGQLAYSVAIADGAIQLEERQKFASIVASELKMHDLDFNVSEIIFEVLDKEKFIQTKDAYDWAMEQIRLNSHYLSPELKQTFINVMEKVAEAYPPVTNNEMQIIDKFKKDITTIHGDPV